MGTLLLATQALLLLVMAILGGFLVIRTRRQKRQQDALVADLKGHRYWRINLARPGFMDTKLRLAPFETKGVLIDEGETIRIQGCWNNDGKPVESTLQTSTIQIKWLGNWTLRAGNLHWAKVNTPQGELYFCADTGLNAVNSREALSDIFRAVFPSVELTKQHTHDFALEKNPRSLGAMVLFFALMGFAGLDTFVLSRYELTDAQLSALFSSPAALLAFFIVWCVSLYGIYRLLMGANVPSRESMTLALLLTTAVGAAMVPTLKRVDQLLSKEPTREHMYRVVNVGVLEPVDSSKGLPPLRFRRANEYWSQFKEGDHHPIPLLNGPLGLWQIDHEKLDAPIIDFYEKLNQ